MERYRPEIDGLRALAVLAVVLFHLDSRWASGGFLGVDVFFVISGYLITQLIVVQLSQGNFSFTDFWLRRARRILPVFTCVVLCSLLVGWFLLLPNDFKNLGRSAISLTFFASNIYFWLKTGYFTAPAETMPLLHTWSLSVEEQFYFIFPIVLYLLTYFFSRWNVKVIFFLILLSFGLTLWGAKDHHIATFFLLPTRAWELLIGCVIALYVPHIEKKNLSNILNEITSILGIIAITYAIFFYHQNIVSSVWLILASCLGTAGIIASNINRLTVVGYVLSLRPLVGIGLISYSLYLWHWPIFVFTKYVSITKFSPLQIIIVSFTSIIIAWISYICIEKPIRQKRFLKKTKTLLNSWVSTAVIIGLIGFIININEGLPNRLNPSVLAAYQEAFDNSKTKCKNLVVSKNINVCANTTVNETPDFILWGDSHARSLLPLIELLADKYQLKFWLHSCEPLLDVYKVNETNAINNSSCFLANHEMIQLIKQKKIRNIIFASFWSQFTEGREIPLEGAGQIDPFYADAKIKSTTPEQARIVFETHFFDTVKILENLGATVWIIKQVPAHQYWISNQLAKVLKYGGDEEKIGRPLSDHLKRQAFIDNVFLHLKSEKVHLLDPSTILCKQRNFCRGTENGHALYFDFNHLSKYGALKLEPLFENMFISIAAPHSRHMGRLTVPRNQKLVINCNF